MEPKAYELRQKRAALVDEMETMSNRITKENRAFTKDENEAFTAKEAEARSLAERISTIERMDAIKKIGDEPETRKSDPLPHEDPSNVGKKHRYSMMRAALRVLGKQPVDGLEGEVSRELEQRTQKLSQGFMMPYRTRGPKTDAEKRAFDTTAGAGSIPTILDKDWIELLRNSMVTMQAGAREFVDLQGKFAIPRQNAATQGYWVAESGAPSASNPTLDQVLFTPHTAGAYTDISRRFFELTMLESGEEFAKTDLTAVLARLVDLAALNGTGASNQPLGILQNTAITATNTVSLGANGGVPSWPAMVELYTIVRRGNAADLGEFSYVGNADVEGTLATTLKASTFPIFLLDNGKVYNRPFYSTQQLPNTLTKGTGTALSPLIGGVWNQLVYAYWSGIDILVDPYTGSSSGTVRIVALQDLDIQVRHPQAFSCIVDMITNQSQ